MKVKINEEAFDLLINIFMYVADEVDGNKRVPKNIKDAYYTAMENKHIMKLYKDLCNMNS